MGSVRFAGYFISAPIAQRVAKALERLIYTVLLATGGMPRALNMMNLDQGDPWTEKN